MELKQIIEETRKVRGYFGNEQLLIALYPFILHLEPKSLLVEIGTFFGQSSRFFSLVNPEINILTMDITGFEGNQGIEQEVLKGGNIVSIRGDSSEVVKGFNWKIDFLFIDGSHIYQDVKNDLQNWSGKVKKSGYLLCHDYNFEGVEKAVGEWVKKEQKDWNFDFPEVLKGNSFMGLRV